MIRSPSRGVDPEVQVGAERGRSVRDQSLDRVSDANHTKSPALTYRSFTLDEEVLGISGHHPEIPPRELQRKRQRINFKTDSLPNLEVDKPMLNSRPDEVELETFREASLDRGVLPVDLRLLKRLVECTHQGGVDLGISKRRGRVWMKKRERLWPSTRGTSWQSTRQKLVASRESCV